MIDENHQHHAAAIAYWHQNKAEQIAFCRVTMLGLLRLSTQARVLSRPLSNDEAWSVYTRYRASPSVQFLVEPQSIEQHIFTLTRTPASPNHLWTDAYLAAFALAGKHRLVSFDGDFARFSGLNFLHLN